MNKKYIEESENPKDKQDKVVTNVLSFLTTRGRRVLIINEFNSDQLIFMELDDDGDCTRYNSFGVKPDAKCTDGTNGSLYEFLGWKD